MSKALSDLDPTATVFFFFGFVLGHMPKAPVNILIRIPDVVHFV